MVLLSVCFREIKTSGFRALTVLCNFKFFGLCFKAIYLPVLMSKVLSMKLLSLLGSYHLEQYISKSFSEGSVITYLFRGVYLKIQFLSSRFRNQLGFHSFHLWFPTPNITIFFLSPFNESLLCFLLGLNNPKIIWLGTCNLKQKLICQIRIYSELKIEGTG